MRGRWPVVLRLVVIGLFSIALIFSDALDFAGRPDAVLDVLVWIGWGLLLLDYVRGVVAAPDRRQYLRARLGMPLILIAPIFVLPDAPFWLLLFLVVGYILELRSVSAGEAFAFSFGLVMFVVAVSAVAIHLLEGGNPESEFSTWSGTTKWAIASLFQIDNVSGGPVTDDGKTLSLVVGAAAILAATLFTAQIVTWIIGSRGDGEEEMAAENRILEMASSLDERMARLDERMAQIEGRLASIDDRLSDRQHDR